MALLQNYYPKRGQVLICDFARGFVPPEMVKSRPVVVVSRNESHGRRLCTVVPCSTTEPDQLQAWHHQFTGAVLPHAKTHITVWAKCDMLYSVSFDRLDLPHIKTQHGGRKYFPIFVSPEDMAAIETCVRAFLSL